MANFQTSFIPQQPLLKVEGLQRRKETLNFPLIIALVVFFVSLILSGGVYFWKSTVEKRIGSQEAILADIEKGLDATSVTHFARVDHRLTSAKRLLSQHAAFSTVLDLVEQTTATNIGLTSIAYTDDEKGVTIAISGQGPSYESVFFQIEKWRSLKPVITELNLEKFSLSEMTGVVDFDASIKVKRDVLEYSRVVKNTATSASTQSGIAPNPTAAHTNP